ncbi:MAG: hypothetical protein IKW85_13455 [Muribaculaceae bacterium]|nr:hypothetical protein [Muribaculaceae bacterium]
MPTAITQDLKYGIIYVIGNPKQTRNLRWFATMIEPMIRPLSLEWVETWGLDHTLIVARRFNVGNIGKYATVQLHLNKYGRSDSYSLLAAVHAFSDCLEDVMDDSEGDVIINEEDYNDRNALPEGKWGASTSSTPFSDVMENIVLPDFDMAQDHTRVELPIGRGRESFSIKREKPSPSSESCEDKDEKPSLGKRLKKLGRKLRKREQEVDDDELIIREEEDQIRYQQEKSIIADEVSYKDYYEDASLGAESLDVAAPTSRAQFELEPETVDIEVEEVREFERINSEYERDVRDLRARIVAFIAKYHQDPQQVMTMMLEGKVLLGTTPGHVLVNGDMKIVLPEYDEMEIKMPAMCRTLYILFMKHRVQSGRGIILKNIDEYRDEIIDIYSLVKPGANESKVEESVNNLCDPLGESLNQMISRANRCIRNVITDKELAKRYIITGARGGEYSIDLAPELMTLPRAVTGA